MAESGGLWIIDGEDAGATPWEFDSISNEGANAFTLQATAKNNGTYGYRALFAGVDDYSYGTYGFAEQSEIYVRFYMYVSAGFALDVAWQYDWICQLRDGGVTLCYIAMRRPATATIDRWNLNGTEDTTNFSLGAWHRFEIRFLQNAGAGGRQIWIDGDLALDDMNNDTSGQAPDSFRVGSIQGTGGAKPANGDYLYFDDIKADTSYVGPYSEGIAIPALLCRDERRRIICP